MPRRRNAARKGAGAPRAGTPAPTLNANSVTTALAGTISGSTQANPGPATVILPFNVNVSTLQPSLGINYIICVKGIYPTRN